MKPHTLFGCAWAAMSFSGLSTCCDAWVVSPRTRSLCREQLAKPRTRGIIITSTTLRNQSPFLQEWEAVNEVGLDKTSRRGCVLGMAATAMTLFPWPQKIAQARCTDIDSCREIGERREEEILQANPRIRLGDSGLQYRVMAPGVGADTVQIAKCKVDIAYSIYQANGSYMYSRGMGYNKINIGNGQTAKDIGSLDSLVVTMGGKDIPVGVQEAMVGMKKGEKRRISCPPSLGFETSDWNPLPVDFRGIQQIKDYKSRLYGRGDTQPPFPSPTIWEIEVLRIRS